MQTADGGEARVMHIELRLNGSLPAGTVAGPGGATREFTGWVGLMSAVDALDTPDLTTAGDHEP